MKRGQNSVYICFDDGLFAVVLGIWQELHHHRIDVFFDILGHRGEETPEAALRQIAARPYFLLILTPETLQNESSSAWFIQQIETAVQLQRIVVPVVTPDTRIEAFAPKLPPSVLKAIVARPAIPVQYMRFAWSMRQIRKQFRRTKLFTAPLPTEDFPFLFRSQQVMLEYTPTTQTLVLSDYHYNCALNLHRDNNDRAAIQEYTQALEIDPDHLSARHDRAVSWTLLGENQKAIEDFTEDIRRYPGRAISYFGRGNEREKLEDYAGAIEDYTKAIFLDPADVKHFMMRAVARRKSSDEQGALSDYNAALAIDPNYSKAYFNRSMIRGKRGDKAGELADLNKAIETNPHYASALYNRGVLRRQAEDWQGAIDDFTRALAVRPDDVKSLTMRGVAKVKSGDPAGALPDFDAAILYGPDEGLHYNNRAYVYTLLGELDKALPDADRAIELDDTNSVFFGTRGKV